MPLSKNKLKKFRKHIASFLLLALALFITPHELLHELVDHTDDCDIQANQSEGNTISALHQHCDVLQLASPPLHFSIHNFSFSFAQLSTILNIPSIENYHFSSSAILFLRGPPDLT